MTLSNQTVARPTDDYDLDAWAAYWAARPGALRSLSAAAADDGADLDGGADPDATKADAGNSDDAKLTAAELAAAKAEADKARKAAEKEKKEREKLAKELEGLRAQAKAFEGIDLESVKQMLADRAREEEEKKLQRGEFESIKKQMMEKHEAERKALLDQIEAANSSLNKLTRAMEDEALKNSFFGSKFIAETIYTPMKARAIYGDHFEIVEGRVVGYDKPKGSADRGPIVDGEGKPVSFDEALRKIIDGDPEKDSILRSKIKEGSGSNPPKGSADKKVEEKPLRGFDKIAAALRAKK